MAYKNIELSFPRFEHDGLRHMVLISDNLGGRGEVTLFVPEEAAAVEHAPLIILLHGVFGTHWAWAFNGGAHLTTARMIKSGKLPPLVLAMPSDGLPNAGSGYIKHPDKDYEKWIVDDVINSMIEVNDCLSEKSPVFIAGLSMGGFGALRLGAKYHDRFAGASGLSSATDLTQLKDFMGGKIPPPQDGECEETFTVFHWMKHRKDKLPPMRFDCGVDDKLFDANKTLHKKLTEEKVPHKFVEYSGAHSWSYWEEHLVDTLDFFAGILETQWGDK